MNVRCCIAAALCLAACGGADTHPVEAPQSAGARTLGCHVVTRDGTTDAVVERAASELGIVVSEVEVDSALESTRAASGLSTEQRDAMLSEQGLTLERHRQQTLTARRWRLIARELNVPVRSLSQWTRELAARWESVETLGEGASCAERWPSIDPASVPIHGAGAVSEDRIRAALGEGPLSVGLLRRLPPEARLRIAELYDEVGMLLATATVAPHNGSLALTVDHGPVFHFGSVEALRVNEQGRPAEIPELQSAMRSHLPSEGTPYTPEAFSTWMDQNLDALRDNLREGEQPDAEFHVRRATRSVDVTLVLDHGSPSCVNLPLVFSRSVLASEARSRLERHRNDGQRELDEMRTAGAPEAALRSRLVALQQELRDAEASAVEELLPRIRVASVATAHAADLHAPRFVRSTRTEQGNQCVDLTADTIARMDAAE